jgi:lantibiotic modifying enzyme
LDDAVRAGEVLLAAAEDAGEDAVCWAIPDGYGGLSGQRYLGYAHGAAGIADALLDLCDATGDERFLAMATSAARWLRAHAVAVLDDGGGLTWPSSAGAELAAAFWCHGSAGIGRFWLHAAQLELLPEASELLHRSLLATARAARWASPVPCHGLAGNIELLLDAYQRDGDRAHLAEARSLQQLLEASALAQDGHLVWPSETPAVITPDYHVGYAGVAATLLRLAAPEQRPHGLSRAGFRYRATATGKGVMRQER